MTTRQLELEQQLGSFDLAERRAAIDELNALMRAGLVALVPEQPIMNLHSHTFFSFNAYNYSPSAFAWEAKKRGLYAVGVMDHETLDPVPEFLDVCDVLGIRGLGGIETRVFIPEWSHTDINMPGEPGIFGFLGCGFTHNNPPRGSHAEQLLQRMLGSARERGATLIGKLNEYLGEIAIDYNKEVLAMVPEGGNATERHILFVLHAKAEQRFPDPAVRAQFWADAMKVPLADVQKLMESPADLQLLIRAKLMKKGSPCFTPEPGDVFPTLGQSVQMMVEMGGVPVAGWLDGMSEGERDAGKLMDLMIDNGVPAVSIIPDRNWNIADPDLRKTKIAKLYEIIDEAARRDMIAVVGTDMSKAGQMFVDDFNAEPMKPLHAAFMQGANVMTGHTRLQQVKGIGLLSEATRERFGDDLAARNAFFEQLGALPPAQNDTERKALRKQTADAWDRTN